MLDKTLQGVLDINAGEFKLQNVTDSLHNFERNIIDGSTYHDPNKISDNEYNDDLLR